MIYLHQLDLNIACCFLKHLGESAKVYLPTVSAVDALCVIFLLQNLMCSFKKVAFENSFKMFIFVFVSLFCIMRFTHDFTQFVVITSSVLSL